MKTLLLPMLFLLLVLIAVAVAVKLAKSQKRGNVHDYRKRQPLTKNEQAMYWRLVHTLPEHVILAQVAISSCVKASGPSFATIVQKSLDFVVCNKALEIIAVIEIDDRSHDKPHRKKGDMIKNEALEKAGIRLIRWPATPLPDVTEILTTFSNQNSVISIQKLASA